MSHSKKEHLISFLVFALMCFFMFGWNNERQKVKPRFHDKPYSFEHTVYDGASWPKDLNDAEINEMRFHKGNLFLATEKGLVKLDFDRNLAVRYQLHSDMPFEWWRSMTVFENKVALSTLVANGSTGGTNAGTHVIDLDTLELNPLEKRITGQVFHNGALYQLSDKKLLVRNPKQGFAVVDTIELKEYVNKGCIYGTPLSTNGAVWVPTWGRATSSNTIYSATKGKCGLIRIPDDGDGVKVINKKSNAMSYHTTQSSFSDVKGLLLVHPTRTQSVSYFHEPDGLWQSKDYSSLAGTLSTNYFWVGYRGATGYSRSKSVSRRISVDSGLQENRFVSAIAVREFSPTEIEVWIAFYVKNYDGEGHYSVESSLEKHLVNL